MNLTQESYSDRHSFRQLHILIDTKIAPVDENGAAVLAALAALKPVQRERDAAQGDPERLAHEASLAAQEAGKTGKKFSAKALLKKKRAAEEYLEEIELELEAAWSLVASSYQRHLAAIEENAAELSIQADLQAQAALATLAGASKMARQGIAQLDPAFTVRNAVIGLLDGQGFNPVQPVARNTEFGQGGAVSPYVGIAVENLGTALGYASQIVDQLALESKRVASQRALDDEDDEIPYTDEEDDLDAETIDRTVPHVEPIRD